MSFALIDVEGYTLTPEECDLLRHPAVFGVILFARNYHDRAQLRALTRAIQRINPAVCIAVDQEGGRVQRFRDEFTTLPSMREWGDRYRQDQQTTTQAFQSTLSTMFTELQTVGVPVTLIPVLDLDYGVSEIIGERSFARDPQQVIELAEILLNTMRSYRMPATAKHFPGHGAVRLDSHEQLPIDPRPFAELWAQDMLPYRHLHQQIQAIMPAHIVYPEVDERPAGFSPIWLQDILRKQIGFEGLIMSDDITMKATESFGNYGDRARLAREAGCDVITVCNHRPGAIQVLDTLGDKQLPATQARAQHFVRMLGLIP